MKRNLRERAAAAWKEKKAILYEEQAAGDETHPQEYSGEQLQSDFERILREITGEESISFWVHEHLIGVVGNLCFVPHIPSKEWNDPVLRRVRLIGICPRCGAETYSRSIADMGDLGEQLESFIPAIGRECALKACPETFSGLSIIDGKPLNSESDFSF
jgi:hypothetical protein